MSGVRDTPGVPTAAEKVNGGAPTDAEALVRSIWSEALAYSEAADDDDFFFCGGDSSRAAGVVARLRASLNVPLTLAAFFEEPTIAGLIRRVELLLREDGRHAAEPSSMPWRNASEARASLAQERFFFADQAAADNAVFNVSWPVRLRGPLDRESLQRALTQIVERHEVLRTRFVVEDGQPTQVVEPPLNLPFAYSDLSADPDPVEAARRLVDEQVHLPFDVSDAPLIRAQLLRLGDGDHVFQLVVHHIAFDDWSMGILFDELGELYAAALAGTEPTLAEPAVQYMDYAEWQRDRLTDEVLDRELAHWQEQLADAPVVDLPTDRPRLAVPTLRGERIRLPLRAELVKSVLALARAEGATPFMAFLAAFDALLQRYTGQDEIVVGTAVDNRGHADLERAVGLFTNPIALRTDLAGDPSLRELIARVRARTIDGVLHQELPFSRLAAALPERDASRHPVFQMFFEFIRPGPRRFELRGFDLELFEAPKRTAEFDLGLYLDERTGRTDAVWEYSTDLFDQTTVERMGRHFELLLEALVADPDRSIGTVPLVSADERRRALREWNNTSVELQPTRIEDAFSERARAVPELAAVQDGTRLLTYAELNERANRLAHLLRSHGVKAGDSVGLCMNRSADLIVAVLGILKSGGAYVPLNPEHPPARLAQQLADAGADVLLTETACAPELATYEGDVVSVDAEAVALAEQPNEDPEPVGTPDDPVYVLYTSGSTGTPKGVVVRHRNLLNYTTHMLGKLGDGKGVEGLHFGVVSAISTDLGNTTVFPSLLGGGCLHVVDEETAKDGALFAEYVREHPLDVLKITPSHLRSFFDAADAAGVLPKRWLVTGGEAATWDLVERAAAAPGLRVLNHYGPTETTVGSCTYDFEPGEPRPAAATVPIGRPISNTRAYVLDANGEPVPVGVRGELYLAGAGVAAGYAGSPEQTDEVFVIDPFVEDVNARMYRTGDLARYLDDGNIEFLGRRDEQVKIRGYRVEPAEVEAALGSHPAVRRAAVVAQGDTEDRRLVAYVVPGPEDVGDLRGFLEERLPAYMVPAAFVTLDALPLTPNGKLDRRALPDPDEQAGVATDVARPSNATEAAIAFVWEELLGREVGVDADFFESGGHSLLAVRLIARLRSEFEVQLTLRDLIADPTIAGLAAKVRASKTDESAADDLPPLVRVPREGALKCSFAQEQFWLVDQLVPGSAAYNFSWPFALDGPLAIDVLERALTELVRRHESLRTRFGVEDGEPVQVVDPPPDRFQLIRHDLRNHSDRSDQAQRLIDEQTRLPFDLERGPLLRVQLLQLEDDEHVLQVVVHHIVFDGVAKLVFLRELSELYEAFAMGKPSPLSDLPVQYGDYAEWQRSWLQGDAIDSLLAHWREQLEGIPEALDLPADRPRPPVTSQKGARLTKTLQPELKVALEALAEGEGATFFMTMLAAFDVLLHRYTGLEDIVVGTPVDNRVRPEIEEAIGVFINTVVIRSDLSGSPSFRQLLTRVRARTLEAVAHQELPFERLVQALHPDRDVSRHPIFQVLLAVNPAEPEAPLRLPGVRIGPVETEWPTARVDLFLIVEEQPHGLDVIWEYSTDLFDKATIQRLAGHFTRLLEQIVSDPDQPVSTVPLLGDDEARHLLVEVNDTSTPIPAGCLHDLIAEQCAASPERVAVEFEGSALTYGELDSRSSRLANHLVDLGVEPEELVAICVDRSADMLVGLLGILKAGAAYVPVDPTYPAERQRFMLEDAHVRVVVTQEPLLSALPKNDAQLVCLDRDWPQIEQLSPEATRVEVTSENLAYVIYTSGSTGTPKGVEIPHRALVNFLATMRERPGLGRDDVLVAVTTLSFDIAGLELYLPLISGARLVVASRDTAADPVALQALLTRTHATVMQATPTTWQMLIDAGWPGNPRLKALCGGEALPGALADQLVGRVGELWNMYGPTETTIWSTIDRVHRGEVLSIGRPIGNTSVYILDEQLQPVPVGVPGELYIGGAGLARGYRGRPDLTTERFLPSPFDPSREARIYKTGDLARYRPDGKVEYLGRLDQQVKVRGFRIELGEIETQLARHPAVAAAVAATDAPRAGEKRLIGYVIPESEPASAAALRTFLEESLPAYMVPSAFVTLDSFPLTPNGKVDRKALPALNGDSDDVRREHVEPTTAMEREIAGLWRELLAYDRIGIDDKFFEIGGHSLLAARVLSRLRAQLDVELPLRALFEEPTIRGLAARIEQRADAPAGPKPPPLVPLARVRRCSFAQESFWFLDQVTENNAVYNVSLPLRLRGRLDLAALGRALNEIVRRHESLRTRFVVEDGKPTQVVEPAAGVDLPVIDLSAAPEADREDAARKLIDKQTQMPLDLAAGFLVRAHLLRLGEDEHVLQLVFHHIAFDGWSKIVLFRELGALYRAFSENAAPSLADLTVQYGDYADWQRSWLTDEVLEPHLAYWQGELEGMPSAIELPTERTRPPVPSLVGAWHRTTLSAGLVDALRKLSRENGATLFTTLLAAFDVLLFRHTGQEDFVVGTPVDTRDRPELEDLIGVFINTVPVRADLSGAPSFRELLGRVRERTLEGASHQLLPFERLVQQLHGERDHSRHPIFQVLLAINPPESPLVLPGLVVEEVESQKTGARLDLSLMLQEHEDRVDAIWEYSTDVFTSESISRLGRSFTGLLEEIVSDPDRPITTLEVLDETERRHVLHEWNETRMEYPSNRCLHELVREVAGERVDAVAVVDAEGDLSYRELEVRSNQLAHRLRGLGVERGSLVGISLTRSRELLVGLLGILKAGAAYVPIDPTYPVERQAFMLEHSEAAVVVTEREVAAKLPAEPQKLLLVDVEAAGIAQEPSDTPVVASSSEDLAYVIYTSGSTGTPKGVEVSHRALVNFLTTMQSRPGLVQEDVLLAVTTLSFDIAGLELYLPLITGARVVIASHETSADPRRLMELLDKHQVSVMQATPTTWRMLIDAGWSGQRNLTVLCGGEALPLSLADQLVERGVELWNMYGPTETTIWSTAAPIRTLGEPLTIGRPIGNTTLYLLDPLLQPVPVGVVGELHIGGDGLARGYRKQPALTAERFIPNPFGGAGERIYKTGDLARYRQDGDVEYVGRIDDQVKLRGFRIELGEIETVLSRHEGVTAAVAAVKEDERGDRRLAAYVVPDHEKAGTLRSYLRLRREGRLSEATCHELPNGMVVAHANLSETEYLFEDIFVRRGYLQHGIVVPDGACVFDVGANIGIFSLLVAESAQQTKIFAFEPIPAVFELLRVNAELHGLDATLLDCGVGAEVGTADFTYFPNNSILSGRFAKPEDELLAARDMLAAAGNGNGTDAGVLEERVRERMASEVVTRPIQTLSKVIADHGVERIDLLKIDAEKSEQDVFAGLADEDWPKIAQVVVEVHGQEDDVRRIVAMLESRDFSVYSAKSATPGEGQYTVYGRRAELEAGSRARNSEWRSPMRLRTDLLALLKAHLPEYMIPGSLSLLEELPLTPNGKLNRAALPEPARVLAGDEYIAPATPLQQAIAEVWQSVLPSDRIGLRSDFFALGGHSLLGAQVITRLADQLGLDLPLRAIFEHPTVGELAAQIEVLKGGPSDRLSLGRDDAPSPRREHAQRSPLSFSQHQLWFLEQWKPGAPTYNLTSALRLRGNLDEVALESAFRTLVERHEALRTAFVVEAEEPVQYVRENWSFELAQVDLREHGSRRDEECLRRIDELMQLPFDLSSDLMLRVTLMRLDDAEHVLVVQSHHIACDGWSEALLLDELNELYETHRNGGDAGLPELAFQYTDFASWQRERLNRDVLDEQLAHWRKELAGAPTTIDLADHPRPAVQTFVGRNLFLSMPRDVADGVRDLARRERATPFMVLLAAFTTVLYRLSGQDDILIGGPVANRSRREFERVVGFVSNTIVLRARLGGNPTFSEFLTRIRETTVGALAHEETPFEKVVEALAPRRDPGVNPLFQVNFRAFPEPATPELSGLEVERLRLDSGATRFDLALELHLREDGIGGFFKYNTDLFESSTIERLAAELEQLLVDAIDQPETRLLGFVLSSGLQPSEQVTRTPGKGIRGSRERRRPD